MYRAILEKVTPKPRSRTAATTSPTKKLDRRGRTHLLGSHVLRCWGSASDLVSTSQPDRGSIRNHVGDSAGIHSQDTGVPLDETGGRAWKRNSGWRRSTASGGVEVATVNVAHTTFDV